MESSLSSVLSKLQHSTVNNTFLASHHDVYENSRPISLSPNGGRTKVKATVINVIAFSMKNPLTIKKIAVEVVVSRSNVVFFLKNKSYPYELTVNTENAARQ